MLCPQQLNVFFKFVTVMEKVCFLRVYLVFGKFVTYINKIYAILQIFIAANGQILKR